MRSLLAQLDHLNLPKLHAQRVQLAHLPTPLEPLPRLRAVLQDLWPDTAIPPLWVKRDDQTGLALGGNKTRKLEYLLAKAQADGADILLTVGAQQSNHARQTAAAAAKLGLPCALILGGDAPTTPSGNLLLNNLLGAQVIWAAGRDRVAVMHDHAAALRAQGRRPFCITYGGSNPLGAAAYTAAFIELQAQLEDLNLFNLRRGHLVVASSSGGTQAGLVLGAKLLNSPLHIHGVSIDQPAAAFRAHIASLANDTSALLGDTLRVLPDNVTVHDAYLGGGYGVVGDLERDALLLTLRAEGLLLDPVYTARAMGGMFDLLQRGAFCPDAPLIFWHTGGAPAVFAYGTSLLAPAPTH
jgi:L-cysteate sulfo-lyase